MIGAAVTTPTRARAPRRAAAARPPLAALRPLLAALRPLLALLLAVAWLAGASPATAAEPRIVTPAAGERVEAAVEITVTSDQAGGTTSRVEVRLRSGGEQIGPVEAARREGQGDSERWVVRLDPLRFWGPEGAALPNGSYRVEARTRSDADGTVALGDWVGHAIVIDALPPVSSLEVRGGGADVSLAWDHAALPDFIRYVVERSAAPDGPFEAVANLEDASATAFTDRNPGPGTWRYRVVVVRRGAEGGERRAASQPRPVEVAAAPVAGGGSGSDDGDQAPPEGGGIQWDGFTRAPRPSEAPGDGQPTAAPRVPAIADPRGDGQDGAAASSGSRPGPPAGFEGDKFEESLPYDPDALEDEVVTERTLAGETTQTATSTVSIANRELDLEAVLTPLAGALLLFVTAGHVLRLRRR